MTTQRPAGRGLVYGLIVCYVTALLMMVGSVLYSNYVIQENSHKWCGFVVTLDDAWTKTPPNSEPGKILAQEMKTLRKEFGC